MVRVCSVKCSIEWLNTQDSKKHVLKARNVEKRGIKLALKTKSDWIKDVQQVFNKFIRLRDNADSCISCGKAASTTPNQWDCGHYRSVGSAPELRFIEENSSKQCKRCNRELSGNIVEYRIRLIDKIGADKLAWLEGPHEPKRYTIEDLKELNALYKRKVKEILQ